MISKYSMDPSHVHLHVHDHVNLRNGQDEITTFKRIILLYSYRTHVK